MNVDHVLAELNGVATNRRSLIKRAAGAGLLMPSLLAIANQPATANGGASLQATGGAKAAANAPANQLFAVYDPVLHPAVPGPKQLSLVAQDETVVIAKDVTYGAWTFNGTVPGPIFRVVEGDQVDFTLSIDPERSPATRSTSTPQRRRRTSTTRPSSRASRCRGASNRSTRAPICITAAPRPC